MAKMDKNYKKEKINIFANAVAIDWIITCKTKKLKQKAKPQAYMKGIINSKVGWILDFWICMTHIYIRSKTLNVKIRIL